MRKPLALGLLLALLAGCGGSPSADITAPMLQAVEDIQTAALTLADEAETLMGDPTTLNLAQAEPRERAFTVVADREETVVIASLKTRSWPPDGEIFGQPMNMTIRCTSDGHGRLCRAWMPVPQNQQQMRWYGARTVDGRQHKDVALEIAQAPATNPIAKQIWSYNKLGLVGPWADGMYCRPCDPTANPVEYHLRYPLPSIPGEELTRTLDLSPLSIVIRQKSMPRLFDLDDPPGVLLRDDLGLVFFPYRNPALHQARSIEDLVGKPLGLLYLQIPAGSKLSKADAARFMNVELRREEPDYTLVLTNLKDPNDVLRLRMGQVQWCDGCFGQDPPPRHLGIEDRLNDAPVISLQVGPLILRGIEKKDIRR